MSPIPNLRTVLCFLLGFGVTISLATQPLYALTGAEHEVFERVNKVRLEHHLIELRPRSDLAKVAAAHALDMASQGYRSHVDRAGRNPLQRVEVAGIRGFSLLAENIGASNIRASRVESVVSEWMLSPVHRENVLNPAFNSTGVGIAEGPDGTTVIVQLYATFRTTPSEARAR